MPATLARLALSGLLLLAIASSACAQEPYAGIGDLAVAKPEDRVDAPSVPPPVEAVVLFDGSGLEGWLNTDGVRPAPWKLVEGRAMQVGGGGIMTRRTFNGHFKLHVEFRV